MRADIELTNFTAGEISPRMRGRIDVSKAWNGCETLLNFVVQPQGGVTRRPGTKLVSTLTAGAPAPRLIPFEFNTLQAYVLAVGASSFNVFRNDGIVTAFGTPINVPTPWAATELAQLTWCQSNDTLYVFHPNHPPYVITRTADNAWSIAPMVFRDGPYLAVNTTPTTLTISGNGGYPAPGATLTLTASGIVGINASASSTGIGFQSTDLYRLIRWKGAALWTWFLITSVISTTQVQVVGQATVPNGAFGGVDGQPWATNTSYPEYAIVSSGTPCLFTGYISGTTLTVDTIAIGSIVPEQSLVWGAAATATQIISQTSGSTGGAGTYTVNVSQTVGSSGSPINFGAQTFYQCAVAGISGSSAYGAPSGTGQAIQDNTVQWKNITNAPTLVSATWALGKWSSTTGWPYCGAFWQQRLLLGGTNNQPNAIEGSVTDDYSNFAGTFCDGTVSSNNAVSWILDDVQQNGITWLSPAGSAQAMQLGIGTGGSEHILQAATTAQALTPTSVQAYKETVYGSAPYVKPLRIGKSLLFPNRPGQKIHEWTFQWQVNGYIGPDIAVLSEHLLRQGVSRMAWQPTPLGIVWMIVNGGLVGMTYLREQDVVAFHRHQLGGQYNGGPPIVEDLVVIPSADGTYDELWLSVSRTAGGIPFRSIEVMTPFFQGTLTTQAWYLDCAATNGATFPTGTAAISGLTETLTVTDQPNTFAGTGTLQISGSNATLAVNQTLVMNGGVATVTAVLSATTATITTLVPFTSQASASAGAWSLSNQITTLSGLSYLAGELVILSADFQMPDVTNAGMQMGSNGVFISALPFSVGVAGLQYNSTLVTMPLEAAAKQGSGAAGKIKALDKLFLRFDATAGGQFGGRSIDPMFDSITDKIEDIPLPAALWGTFSGVRRLSPTIARDFEQRVIVEQNTPFPMTVLSIGARLDLGDMQ